MRARQTIEIDIFARAQIFDIARGSRTANRGPGSLATGLDQFVALWSCNRLPYFIGSPVAITIWQDHISSNILLLAVGLSKPAHINIRSARLRRKARLSECFYWIGSNRCRRRPTHAIPRLSRSNVVERSADADERTPDMPFGLVRATGQPVHLVERIDLAPQDALDLVRGRRDRDGEGLSRLVAAQPPGDDPGGNEALAGVMAAADRGSPVGEHAIAYLTLFGPDDGFESDPDTGGSGIGVSLPKSSTGSGSTCRT
jgi:hypothetical protein